MREILTVSVRPDEHTYLVRSLETGEEVVMFATPYKIPAGKRWSWTSRTVTNTKRTCTACGLEFANVYRHRKHCKGPGTRSLN